MHTDLWYIYKPTYAGPSTRRSSAHGQLENVQKMLSSAIVAATLSISISEEEFTVQVLSPIHSTSVCPYLPLLSGSVEIEGKVSVVDRKQSSVLCFRCPCSEWWPALFCPDCLKHCREQLKFISLCTNLTLLHYTPYTAAGRFKQSSSKRWRRFSLRMSLSQNPSPPSPFHRPYSAWMLMTCFCPKLTCARMCNDTTFLLTPPIVTNHAHPRAPTIAPLFVRASHKSCSRRLTNASHRS